MLCFIVFLQQFPIKERSYHCSTLCICVSVLLCLSLSQSIPDPLCPSLCVSFCPSLSVSVPVHPSVCLCLSLAVSVNVTELAITSEHHESQLITFIDVCCWFKYLPCSDSHNDEMMVVRLLRATTSKN